MSPSACCSATSAADKCNYRADNGGVECRSFRRFGRGACAETPHSLACVRVPRFPKGKAGLSDPAFVFAVAEARPCAHLHMRRGGENSPFLSIGLVSVVLRVGLVVSGENGRLMLARPSVCSIGKLKDGHPECHDC